MKRRGSHDPLVQTIEHALAPGEFISYSQSWGFVSRLEEAKAAIDAVAISGDAGRAVGLYELFLAGCHDKAEEADDSGGNLGMFFEELFIAWIKARQRAGCDAAETVRQIVTWMRNDKYGFCYQIERHVAKALGAPALRLFREHVEQEFEHAFAAYRDQQPRRIHDYPSAVYMTAAVVKNIYVAGKNVEAYVALCARTLPSPRDCEQIATLLVSKRRRADALAWVEKGLALEKKGQWGNESSHGLTTMKEESLSKLGPADEALASAWSAFQQDPSSYTYANVMKYAGRERARWREQAMQVARQSSLSAFMDICTSTGQWDALAERVLAATDAELEGISHYVTEKAAKGLGRKHGLAAAKVYRALGMRILASAKSKYYQSALEHFRQAKQLYEKHGKQDHWRAIVDYVRTEHTRKSSFIHGFERLMAGRKQPVEESFEARTRAQWRRQTSK